MTAYTFAESCIPPLQSGEYVLTVTQMSGTLGNSQTLTQEFSVAGPRLSLAPGEIQSVYPPPQMAGSFGSTLPHIVFQRKTLPWERSPEQRQDAVCRVPSAARPGFVKPWIALLTLCGGEILPVQTGRAGAVTAPADPDTHFPGLTLSRDEAREQCRYIDVPRDVFLDLMPRYDEIQYLSHVRKTEPADKADQAVAGDAWVSVVIGNRLPAVSETGAGSRVYAVSLEGFGDYHADAAVSRCGLVRLIVLHSWAFTSVTTPCHFRHMLRNLSVAAVSLPGPAPNETIKPLLDNGYVPVAHTLRNGDQTVSFYRGPLVPVSLSKKALTAMSADSLYKYDPDTGTFDVSYASAWQMGRLIALNNPSIAMQIMQKRAANYRALHKLHTKEIFNRCFNLPGDDGFHRDTVGKTVLDYLNKTLGGAL